MLYYSENVIDVSSLCEDEEMRKGMEYYTLLRNSTLNIVKNIPGYDALPRKERRRIYDKMRKQLEEFYSGVKYIISPC